MDTAQPEEAPTTDREHEATDVVEAPSDPEPVPAAEHAEAAEDGVADEQNGAEPEPPTTPKEDEVKETTPTTSPPTSPGKKITAKPSVSVKSPAGKAAPGPPTPLVKKVR